MRFELEAGAAGPGRLKFNDPKGLKLWVGDTEIPVMAETSLDLKQGRQTITLSISENVRKGAPLRIELVDIESVIV